MHSAHPKLSKYDPSPRQWVSVTRKYLCTLTALFSTGGSVVLAGQELALFPSHRFPTDRSFHLGYMLGRLSSTGNFVSGFTKQPLQDNDTLSVGRSIILAEIQPNNQVSIGAEIHYDRVNLADSLGDGDQVSGFADQKVFLEYRFIDVPGYSFGVGLVGKFPGYSNPSLSELESQNGGSLPARVPVLGDGQTDFSVLTTTEMWPGLRTRIRANVGYTYRSSGLAAEIPFEFAAGYATPRATVDLKLIGYLSANNAHASSSLSEYASITKSRYAFGVNPVGVALAPSAEVWLTPSVGLIMDYAYSLAGRDSPYFHRIQGGLLYRWAEKVDRRVKTFRQVDIKTDQESGKFQGESQLPQGKNPLQDNRPFVISNPEPEEEFR